MAGLLYQGNTPGRGTQRHSGGAYDGDAQQDIMDGDSLQGGVTALTGAADVINPQVAGNYVIKAGAADLIVLGAPRPGTDDNLSLNIWSDTLFAHTVTATALFANGTALKTTATFAAFRGAGMTLRAMNGVWHVLASSAVTFT